MRDFETGWGTPIKIGEWETSLIWCPSQMYYGIEYQGKRFYIYCRWRHIDPWTIELLSEEANMFDWSINLSDWKYFKEEDPIETIQKYALEEAIKRLPEALKSLSDYQGSIHTNPELIKQNENS